MPDPNQPVDPANQSSTVSPTDDTYVSEMPDLINAGSAAPGVNFPDPAYVEEPKKKYGGGKGKIIATILGLILLVGGVGTGVYLSQQNQNPEERAAGLCGYCVAPNDCKTCAIGETNQREC